MGEPEAKAEQKPKECKEKKEHAGHHGLRGFHGFGPRCNARGFMACPPMGMGMGFPCHGKEKCKKEKKCECGEVVPKREPGQPKIKVCPKCNKDLPKKCHGYGLGCRKMKKMAKLLQSMPMFGSGFGFGQYPPFFPPCPPPPPRGLEVHHYIHFDPPQPSGFGFPPMSRPPFGFPPMGPFGFPPKCPPPPFGKPPCGPCGPKPPCGPCGPWGSKPPCGPFGRF